VISDAAGNDQSWSDEKWLAPTVPGALREAKHIQQVHHCVRDSDTERNSATPLEHTFHSLLHRLQS